MASDQPKMTTEFPQDILFFHILPRLPGNSVLRFKRVSKQWNSFLSTPLFKNMHLQYIPNEDHHTPHKLLILSETRPFKFRTIDCEAPEDGLTTSRILPFKVTDDDENVCALTSFRGLVCVGISSRFLMEYSNLILWNPLTGDHKISETEKAPKGGGTEGRVVEDEYNEY
ncbi:F-box/kelch-repeat protein-like protein [Tanacetum coccineum]